MAARIRRVAFLNVGQGDSALVEASAGWTALFDGGREHELEPFEPFLRSIVEVHLMVGTHFDADHLEGLCWALESGALERVGHAIVPAQVHPAGDLVAAPRGSSEGALGDQSPLLAHHLMAGRTLAEIYSQLETRARRIEPAVDELARAVEARSVALSSDADASGHRSATEQATAAADEAELPAIARLLAVAGGARALAERHAVERRAMPRRDLVRAAVLLERELISASNLKRLIAALHARGIPWTAQPASDAAARLPEPGLPAGLRLWHLAPTTRFVRHYARHVADVWDRIFRVMESVDTGVPTLSNRLSHVMVLEDTAGRAVAICGDAGFQYGNGVPDSLADRWEEPFGRVSLLHLPHHAGRWGRFGARARGVLETGAAAPLAIYGSVGHRKENPPGSAVVPFVRSLAERRPDEATLYVANRPGGALGRLVKRALPKAGEGPAILELRPDGGTWSAAGLDHRGERSDIPPIGVRLG